MHTNEVYYTNNINAVFSEHECILLIAKVIEYISFLGWFSFQCDCFFTMSECHICTITYMPFDMWQNVHVLIWHVHITAYEIHRRELYYTISLSDVT